MKWAPEIRKFHVSLRQRRLRNVQISVMHVQSCSVNINLLLFLAVVVAVVVAAVAKTPRSRNFGAMVT